MVKTSIPWVSILLLIGAWLGHPRMAEAATVSAIVCSVGTFPCPVGAIDFVRVASNGVRVERANRYNLFQLAGLGSPFASLNGGSGYSIPKANSSTYRPMRPFKTPSCRRKWQLFRMASTWMSSSVKGM